MVYFNEVDISTVGTITPTGDRSVDNHHSARKSETWRAYIIPLDKSAQEDFIAATRKILHGINYAGVSATKHGICINGHLEKPDQEKLEGLVQRYEPHLKQTPIRVIGDYFSFLGQYWIEEAMEQPKQGSLF